MSYTFGRQKLAGDIGEKIIKAHLENFYFVDNGSQALDLQGVDMIAIHRESQHRMTVQVKTDEIAETSKYAAIETVSNDVRNIPGWVHTCKADVIAYLLLPSRLCYWVEPHTLRESLPAWEASYRKVKAQNVGYQTISVLIPLRELDAIAINVERI